MSGRMDVEFSYAQPQTREARRRSKEGPLRILVMADLSGRGNRGIIEHGAALADRPTVPVDVDNLDDVLFRFAPRLHLTLSDSTTAIALELKRFEDFHPDRLYDRLELFRAFRDMRERIDDPNTSDEQVAELRRVAEQPAVEESTPGRAETDSKTLERLLGRSSREPAQARVRPTTGLDVGELVKRLVEPYIVRAPASKEAHLVRAVDAATSEQMRRH